MNECWHQCDSRNRIVTIEVVKRTRCYLWYKDGGAAHRVPLFGWFPTTQEAVAVRRRVLEAEQRLAWSTFATCRAALDKFRALYGDTE